jgi:hypothetical protein
MGQFPTLSNFISRALDYTPTDTIDARSAWLFENQSGTLGTNLTGSSVYVGVTGTVRVIVSGTVGIQNTVTNLTLISGGAGYINENGVSTTAASIVPASNGEGLTLDLIVPPPTVTNFVNGTGYVVGPFTTLTDSLNGTGMRGTIDSVFGGIQTLTLFGGTGYEVGDLIFFIQAGANTVAEANLATAPNGAITAATINKSGANYGIGDIITVTQALSDSDATFRIDGTRSLEPGQPEAIEFLGAQAGSILPVVVDYVLVPAANAATNLIVGK